VSAPIRWWATTADPTRVAVVVAETWYGAREKAARDLGTEPGRVVVKREVALRGPPSSG